MDINFVILIGKLANTPQELVIDYDKHPHAVKIPGAKFRLITKKYKKTKETTESTIITERHNIKVFNQNALYSLDKLKQGSKVFILGELHYHMFKTEDNKVGQNTEIIAKLIIDFKQDKDVIKDKLMKLVTDNTISTSVMEKILTTL